MAPCVVVERLEGKQRCSRAEVSEHAGIQSRKWSSWPVHSQSIDLFFVCSFVCYLILIVGLTHSYVNNSYQNYPIMNFNLDWGRLVFDLTVSGEKTKSLWSSRRHHEHQWVRKIGNHNQSVGFGPLRQKCTVCQKIVETSCHKLRKKVICRIHLLRVFSSRVRQKVWICLRSNQEKSPEDRLFTRQISFWTKHNLLV